MPRVFSTSSPLHEPRSIHPFLIAMEKLLHTISGTNSINSGLFQDLVVVLEQVLSMVHASQGTVSPLLIPEIIRIAQGIQTEYERAMKSRVFVLSINQLEAMDRELAETLASDCRMLKVLLQSIISMDNSGVIPPSTLNASMLDGAHGIQIDRGNTVNVAGYSNSVTFIQQELGISFRNVLVLLLLGFLFFRLV